MGAPSSPTAKTRALSSPNLDSISVSGIDEGDPNMQTNWISLVIDRQPHHQILAAKVEFAELYARVNAFSGSFHMLLEMFKEHGLFFWGHTSPVLHW